MLVLAAAACFVSSPPSAASAEGDPAIAVARAEFERTRSAMELVYLDAARDHARVRQPEWARTPFGDAFTALVAEFVKASRPPSPPRTEAEDFAAAEALERRAATKGVDVPLAASSLLVVLAETARRSRADAMASERDLFVAAAKAVFAEPRPEDAWDAHFTVLPAVAAYRAARARLDALEKRPDPGLAAERSAAPAAPPSAAPEPRAEASDPLEGMILCERPRPWVGPWIGWTADIPEKQNKRQQRSVKVVWIDRHEVTCAQYAAFLASLAPVARKAMLPAGWSLGADGEAAAPEGRARHPVTGVTFAQADAYAESLGKRLPTSDEWERAAGGGEKEPRDFPWGTGEKVFAHAGLEPSGTRAVDDCPDDATPDGVLGLAGNAAELVATYTDRTDVGKNGAERGRQTFVCGGSFRSRASECVPGFRWVLDEGAQSPTVGFRCVIDDAEYRRRKR